MGKARKCEHLHANYDTLWRSERLAVFGCYKAALGEENFGYGAGRVIFSARCTVCNQWLPLGPSNDDSDAVRVEIRAAELEETEHWKPVRVLTAERWGWEDYHGGAVSDPDSYDDSPEWHAGYLAHEIAAPRNGSAEWPWDPTRPVAGQYEERRAAFAAAARTGGNGLPLHLDAVAAQNPTREPDDTPPDRLAACDDCTGPIGCRDGHCLRGKEDERRPLVCPAQSNECAIRRRCTNKCGRLDEHRGTDAGVLCAAPHPDTLQPAVWNDGPAFRKIESKLELPLPPDAERRAALERLSPTPRMPEDEDPLTECCPRDQVDDDVYRTLCEDANRCAHDPLDAPIRAGAPEAIGLTPRQLREKTAVQVAAEDALRDPEVTRRNAARIYESQRLAEPDCRDEDGPEVERLMAEATGEHAAKMTTPMRVADWPSATTPPHAPDEPRALTARALESVADDLGRIIDEMAPGQNDLIAALDESDAALLAERREAANALDLAASRPIRTHAATPRPSPRHCDDYIDDESQTIALRVFLRRARSPAHGMLIQEPFPKLFADHDGKRVRVVMASRLGDVGITTDLAAECGYQKRVAVEELANFGDSP